MAEKKGLFYRKTEKRDDISKKCMHFFDRKMNALLSAGYLNYEKWSFEPES